jgi:hypothetical protein
MYFTIPMPSPKQWKVIKKQMKKQSAKITTKKLLTNKNKQQ